MPLVPRVLGRPVEAVRRWPVESQQRARRNALVASTALAERRAERDDVEGFLLGRATAVPQAGTHAGRR